MNSVDALHAKVGEVWLADVKSGASELRRSREVRIMQIDGDSLKVSLATGGAAGNAATIQSGGDATAWISTGNLLFKIDDPDPD